MPGGGWIITSLEPFEVSAIRGKSFIINRTIIERGNQKQLVYYWFEQRGRRIASEYKMKWYLLLDGLLKNRTDGALVRVTTVLSSGERMQDADERLQRFLNSAMPVMGQYVPE